MTHQTSRRAMIGEKTRRRLWTALLGLLWLLPVSALAQAPERDASAVYRYDPVNLELIPTATGELKRGHIYNYFSAELGRRAWSFYLGDGRFWHPLGPTTVQSVWRFDIRQPRAEVLDALEDRRTGGAWAARGEGVLYLRLTDEGEWVVAVFNEQPSIYDLTTLRRWIAFHSRYIPVSHTFGYDWIWDGREFHPANRVSPRALLDIVPATLPDAPPPPPAPAAGNRGA